MPTSLDHEASEGFGDTSEMSEAAETLSISDFRSFLKEINIRIDTRQQRVLYRHFKQTFLKGSDPSDEETWEMIKQFLIHPAPAKNIEVIRHDCMRTANLWTLDKNCGIELTGDQLPANSAVKQELDRLQRCAARLPVNVNEKDTRKRDWMFQRYDIGKTGRLVMAAVDNMIHIQFGEVAYDVKDVIRAAFRATKNVSIDSGAVDPSSYTQIERQEFRLFLLALKSHIELFIQFKMVDHSNDMKIDFDEFKKSLPLLKKWGVDTSDPQALFEIIDADHSGEITFAEFVNWALKEAIISDLEYRERVSHKVDIGDTVLLTGDLRGIVAKVISYDRNTKTYVLELPDGKRINKKNTEFFNGAATEEVLPVLPPGTYQHSKWFECLLKDIMPGTDHPWITEEPIYIKSEWSTRRGEYHFEIRCKFGGDSLKHSAWAKSFREAKNFAAQAMKTEIEKHPTVLKAQQYVNMEVAKEKEAESKRMNELKGEQDHDHEVQEAYRTELWKRNIIGQPDIDENGFFKIIQDCGCKDTTHRETNVVHRSCAKGRATASFADLTRFFDDALAAKHLDRKLQGTRTKILKSWKAAKWQAFVDRSNPDKAEEHFAEWDQKHEKPSETKQKELAAVEVKDEPKKEDEEVVEARNQEFNKLKQHQAEIIDHLSHFLEDDDEDDGRSAKKGGKDKKKKTASPTVKIKKKSGLTVKSASKKTMSTDVKETKKVIVRKRPPSGKKRS